LLGILIFSIVALSLVYLSFRVGVDPDNVVVPLLTSIVDALTIPLIVGVSALLV